MPAAGCATKHATQGLSSQEPPQVFKIEMLVAEDSNGKFVGSFGQSEWGPSPCPPRGHRTDWFSQKGASRLRQTPLPNTLHPNLQIKRLRLKANKWDKNGRDSVSLDLDKAGGS